MAVWSPDGERMMFSSSRQHTFDLYIKNSNGSTEEKVVEHGNVDRYSTDWSRDGKSLLFIQGNDLWVMDTPGMQSRVFLKAAGTIRNGEFSPDGKWVAYASNETGKWEVYVTSFPDAKAKWQVSSAGGDQPRWRGDGKELFYLSPEAKVMAVPVKGGASFDAGTAEELFQANPRERVATSEQMMYDVSADGQKFLINTRMKNEEARPMTVVLNWLESVK
jgi:eukaryotic-like serine/threonine-protein kinase